MSWLSLLLCVTLARASTLSSTYAAFGMARHQLSVPALWTSPDSSSQLNNQKNHNSFDNSNDSKVITFIRHGCTYMNEYLGGADGGRRFGSPHFTDVFVDPSRRSKYHDTPLSPHGRQQAQALAAGCGSAAFIQHCQLVVTSPLTRALQTWDIGLQPHFLNCEVSANNYNAVSVIALPEAAERLYLISDVGRSVTELKAEFPHVDFETGFPVVDPPQDSQQQQQQWWWHPTSGGGGGNNNYVEWRPIGRGQRYACLGEPATDFHQRMGRLYAWLQDRPETSIAVVCHHGVIDWMLDMDFDNCQYHQVPFHSIRSPMVARW